MGLKAEIKQANQEDAYMILVYHDPGDKMKRDAADADFSAFKKVLEDEPAPIIGVFHGHYHSQGGLYDSLHQTKPRIQQILNKWNEIIPVYLDWAADKQRFLLVQYDEYRCTWRIGAVQAWRVDGFETSPRSQWFSINDG